MDNEVKEVKDSITFKEDFQVIRYKGSKNIKEMIGNGMHIEAFAHSQLGIEKILWDKIVGIFEPNKARAVRAAIDQSKQQTRTFELIKWAYFLGAINDDEYRDLKAFYSGRNKVMHGHGEWWNIKENEEALQKGIRFLEKSGM
jgi:hypothetical protein